MLHLLWTSIFRLPVLTSFMKIPRSVP